jgi:hypothetical protein
MCCVSRMFSFSCLVVICCVISCDVVFSWDFACDLRSHHIVFVYLLFDSMSSPPMVVLAPGFTSSSSRASSGSVSSPAYGSHPLANPPSLASILLSPVGLASLATSSLRPLAVGPVLSAAAAPASSHNDPACSSSPPLLTVSPPSAHFGSITSTEQDHAIPDISGSATIAFGVPGADTAVHAAGRVASGFCSADRGAPVASGVMYETDGCIMAYT